MKLDPAAYKTQPASSLTAGTKLAPLSESITYATVVASAAATWAFFGGHSDTTYARLQGRRDIYLATGPINGLVDRYLASRVGPEAFLRTRKLTMRESICAGDEITIVGEITRTWVAPAIDSRIDDCPIVEVSIAITNQLGASCVVATATLQLPAEPRPVN